MDSFRSCSTSEKTLSTFCSFSLSVSIILGSSRRYPVIYMVGYTNSKCKQKTYHLVLLVKANLKWHKPKNVHLDAPDRTSLFKWWVMQSIACNLADTCKYTQNKLSPAGWLYSPFNQQWYWVEPTLYYAWFIHEASHWLVWESANVEFKKRIVYWRGDNNACPPIN